MKLAIVTDIHFGVRNDRKLFLDNQLQFFDEQFFPYLTENNIEEVCILGDTFDRRKYINFNTLHRLREEFFPKLREYKCTMIYGNHDVYYNNTNTINSVDMLFDACPEIDIIDTWRVKDFDGLPIAFVSWINSENANDAVQWIKECHAPILMGHFEFKNFYDVCGFEYTHGQPLDIFNGYEKVFSGHYHKKSDDGHLFYLGNPTQISWDSYKYKQGFHIFDTSTRELEFIENKFNVYHVLMFDGTKKISDIDFTACKDRIVRVFIPSFEQVAKKIDVFVQELEHYTNDIEIVETEAGTEQIDAERLEDLINHSNTEDLIKNYVDATIDDTDLKHNAIYYIDTLYKNALSAP